MSPKNLLTRSGLLLAATLPLHAADRQAFETGADKPSPDVARSEAGFPDRRIAFPQPGGPGNRGPTAAADVGIHSDYPDASDSSSPYLFEIFVHPDSADGDATGSNAGAQTTTTGLQMDGIQVVPVPETSTCLLGLAGTCGLMLRRRRIS